MLPTSCSAPHQKVSGLPSCMKPEIYLPQAPQTSTYHLVGSGSGGVAPAPSVAFGVASLCRVARAAMTVWRP
jgi:hypothetical protein